MESDQPHPGPGATGPSKTSTAPAPRRAHRRASQIAFTSTAAGLLAVAVVAAGTALASAGAHHAGHTGPRPAGKAVPAGQLRQLKREAAAQQAPARQPNPKPWGTVVGTGIQTKSGELVFYAVHVHVKQLPLTTFGIMGGFRDSAGHLTAAVESNEFTGPDLAEGFHEPQAPISGVPEFGYYAGPAAKITGTLGGRTIQAALARWSVNPKVVIFWFSPAGDPAGLDITNLAAFNAQGKQLPSLHNGIGHG